MHSAHASIPYLGFGLGLRIPHYAHIFEHWPSVDWFEIISENFMDTEGKPKRNLQRIRERYPVVMHGIALSIGTIDPLNSEYLKRLKRLADVVNPAWISDHLCWTGIAHTNTHDLLPVPYTEEALKHIVSRIKQVQDVLERPIALENPSTYLEFKASHIPEADFIAHMAEDSGCHLLLDVNNVYVSCYNHRLDPKTYIDALPLDKVIQIHLSGHSNMGTHIIDTHDDHVVDDVWALYRYVTHKAGRTINTMVEWDDNIPSFDVLYAELGKAKQAAHDAQNPLPLPQLARQHLPYTPNIVTPLAEIQTHMQEAVLRGADMNSKPDTWIRIKEDFPPTEQLAVYVNAYRIRLKNVTAEEYPVLKQYMGKDVFENLLEDFVDTVPSHHFNIGRYTAHLPDFLAKYMAKDGFARELVILENALSHVADLPETIALEPAHLAGITAESLMQSVLHPRAALQLLAFTYPVNRYYMEVKEEQSPPAPTPENTFLAVFRHEDIVWRMDIDEQEYRLMQLLFMGMPIGEALEELQRMLDLPEDTLSQHLSVWFSRWMRNGLLSHHELTT
jgi:uncharacterized protein (UPF0276 family)